MSDIVVNQDGSLSAKRNSAEIIVYYEQEIDSRMKAMLKLLAYGADLYPVQMRIAQLNAEKKQRLTEV